MLKFLISLSIHPSNLLVTWFVGLDKGMISSFTELVETFCSHRYSEQRDKWTPHVKDAKDLSSKESQNKDQVKATISQGLTDDISSMMDESPQVGEYDYCPIYEDLEFLVEDSE